jgi:ribosomal-protein-alanine N-acetyltransferase
MSYLVEPAVDPIRMAGPQPAIVSGDLMLRRWNPRDAAQLVAAYGDPDISHWNLRRLDSENEAQSLIHTWKRGWRRKEAASWAVVRMDDVDKVLGQIGFRSLYLGDGMAEISYWVVPGQRRMGLATRANLTLSDWAIKELGLHRLELVHSVHNAGSCRVAVNSGFEIEGVKRQLQQHADGWHDMCLHARIRTASCRCGPAVVGPTASQDRGSTRAVRGLPAQRSGGPSGCKRRT